MEEIDFADTELEQAEQLVRDGKYDRAKKLVKNARFDVEDFAEADTVGEQVSMEKFEQGVEQFLSEDSRESPLSTLDSLQTYLEKMSDERPIPNGSDDVMVLEALGVDPTDLTDRQKERLATKVHEFLREDLEVDLAGVDVEGYRE